MDNGILIFYSIAVILLFSSTIIYQRIGKKEALVLIVLFLPVLYFTFPMNLVKTDSDVNSVEIEHEFIQHVGQKSELLGMKYVGCLSAENVFVFESSNGSQVYVPAVVGETIINDSGETLRVSIANTTKKHIRLEKVE